MHIVVVGAGRVGASLARGLVAAGHEVAVVDTDRSRCDSVEEALGSVAVHGDGTDPGVLASAGANRADALIATSRNDATNLASCQIARHVFEISRTVSVVNDSDHTDLFRMLEIDVTVDVSELVLGRIQEAVSIGGLSHLMPLSGEDGRRLLSIKIPADSGIESRAIKDMALPNGALISLVIARDGTASIPGENTVISSGDEVVAVANAQEEEQLRDLLVQTTGL